MNKKAFTLLELAIVLLIIGVLSAGAMRIMSGAFTSSQYTRSKNSITLAVKEIADYTVRARRLPGSIIGTRIISQEKDAFNTNLQYFADTTATTTASICSLTSTPLTINVCSTADCTGETITENNIAFILVSLGENRTQQYTLSGTTYTFYKGGVTVGGVESDDVVGWMTLNTLKAMAGCEGSLTIEQNKLPDAIAMNTYSYTLTPKGGVAPYDWCIETDNHKTLLDAFFFGPSTNLNAKSVNSRGACSSASNYVNDIGEVILNTNSNPLDENKLDNDDSGSSLITVRLKDSQGTEFVKQYDLRLLRQFEVAMDAPKSNITDNNYLTVVTNGSSNFVTSDTTSGGVANNNTAIVNANEIKLVQNSGTQVISVLYNCSANPSATTLPCPKFGNKGLIATYFTVEFYRNPSAWQEALGFTFAIIKSYVAGTTYTSTVKMTGNGDAGLGYGGSGGDHKGIKAGNSFALEFDLKSDGKNDINKNHMAIVSYANINNYDGTWDNQGNFNNNDTFTAYGDNVHDTLTGSRIYATTYNDQCGSGSITSGVKGYGCYYNTTTPPIENSYSSGETMGIRLEAIGGCNSDGSVCNAKTGANNYTCTYVWKYNTSELNSNTALKAAMTNKTAHYVYDKLKNGTAYPTGTPLMKDCFPDNTTYLGTLDYFRYGFTTSNYYSSSSQLYYKFTDFFLSSGQYTP